MAFKLTKNEEDHFKNLKEDVNTAFEKVEAAVIKYNEEEAKLQENVTNELTHYNQTLAELRSFVEEVSADRRTEYDEKSDGWKEGDNGSAADEWISAWEEADLEEPTIGFADPLELGFENHADIDLPTEP